MENDILEILNAVGYEGENMKPEILADSINNGAKSERFRQLIGWITGEMRVLANVEEKVSTDGEINDFMLELSSFLKEISCPFNNFITGPISNRFQNVESRSQLLDYLLTELMAMKMVQKLRPKKQIVIEIAESPAAASLKSITIDLNMGKPPENISPKIFFGKINTRVDDILKKSGENRIGKPLFTPTKPLTSKQWNIVEKFQQELDREYDLRRQMLITRLDVTVQSFQWSDKLRGKGDDISHRYTQARQQLDQLQTGGMSTDIAALLAARDELAIIEKTSSANVRKNTKSDIQKHVMGRVPDRGGRAYEHAPPPPEMPSWQQRSSGGGGGSGRGGGGGGGGGGRGGGNFNQNRGGGGGGGGGGGSYQPQRQQSQQDAGYPPQSSGYQQSVGYQSNYHGCGGVGAGRGGGFQQQNYGGGGEGAGRQCYDNRQAPRVQGGWSQGGASGGGGAGGGRNFNDNSYSSGGGGGGGSGGSGTGNNNNRAGGGANYNNQGGSGDYNRDNSGGGRGRSNYRRGGGGGGGGTRNY